MKRARRVPSEAPRRAAAAPPQRAPEQTRAVEPKGTPPSGWSLGSVPVSPSPEPAAQDLQSAPPVVHELLESPGEPLDPATRTSMESSFGYDFGHVRMHSDERAARSTEAVGAAAYTVGPHVAFGRGLYEPNTAAGQKVLAHELAHVVEDEGASMPTTLTVGREHDPAEREAEAQASRVTAATSRAHGSQAAVRHAAGRGRTAVLRRTSLGALLGGAGGLIAGAAFGALLGGPIGALVGGAIGLIAGAVAGETATTKSRPLTATEITYAKEIYLDSIDYSKIKITRDSVLALGAPRTIGNTIHLKSDWGHFKGDTLDLTEQGQLTLIHEMGHVWQYQNGGLAYIPLSLIAQIKGAVSGGDRGKAYEWREAHEAKIPWEEWNPEQQAEAIEEYNKLLRKQKEGKATPEEIHILSVLLPYIEKVRRGEGAPTFGGPPSPSPAGGPSPGAPI